MSSLIFLFVGEDAQCGVRVPLAQVSLTVHALAYWFCDFTQLSIGPIWRPIVDFFNSNFTAALAGALAGALTAWKIGDRSKQRELLLQELRSTNAAIMLCFTIVNAALDLKKQQFLEMYATYKAKKGELAEFQRRHKAGEIPADQPFQYQADLRYLQMPTTPIDLLTAKVFEGISVRGRPLALTAVLPRTIDALADSIRTRNALIDRFRALGADAPAQLPALYFGVAYGPGHLSTEYSDTMDAINDLTNDTIFFSVLLEKDLESRGQEILAEYTKVARMRKEKVQTIDFSDARTQGLLPDDAHYPDWLRMTSSTVERP